MAEITSRELRDHTRRLLDRVAAGEHLTITVDGRAVAELAPTSQRPRWVRRERFVERVLGQQADPALAVELSLLSSETTDDLPL